MLAVPALQSMDALTIATRRHRPEKQEARGDHRRDAGKQQRDQLKTTEPVVPGQASDHGYGAQDQAKHSGTPSGYKQ